MLHSNLSWLAPSAFGCWWCGSFLLFLLFLFLWCFFFCCSFLLLCFCLRFSLCFCFSFRCFFWGFLFSCCLLLCSLFFFLLFYTIFRSIFLWRFLCVSCGGFIFLLLDCLLHLLYWLWLGLLDWFGFCGCLLWFPSPLRWWGFLYFRSFPSAAATCGWHVVGVSF